MPNSGQIHRVPTLAEIEQLIVERIPPKPKTSIGVALALTIVLALVGSAVSVTREISEVRLQSLEALARVGERVESLTTSLAGLQSMTAAMQARIEQAATDSRLTTAENRLRIAELERQLDELRKKLER